MRGATVFIWTGYVSDAAAVAKWYGDADDRVPFDLVIANAGVFDGHGGGARMETSSEATQLVATNLLGAIYTAHAAMPRMIARRSGHIALMSSLAARLPLADAPAYSATKAGLLAYAEDWREYLLPYDVCVSTILPGHVRTAQTDLHEGPMPFILAPEEAAQRVRRAGAAAHGGSAAPARTFAWSPQFSSCLGGCGDGRMPDRDLMSKSDLDIGCAACSARRSGIQL